MITIPTTTQIYDLIIASIEAKMDATIDEDGKSALRAEALTLAGAMKLQYLAIASLQKNIFVDTCDEETLLRVGRIKLGRLPFPAVAGKYTIAVTGTIGATVPAQRTWKSDDDSRSPGVLFILDEAYVLTATTDTITVRCLVAGEDGKLNVGDTLSVTSPIPLVDKVATVTVETVQPLAGEELEDYRTKVLNSYRLEAQGGSPADYRIWTSDVQGVEKVYAYAKSGATSEVDLYIEATLTDSTDGKGTPTGTILTDVEAVVNFNPDTSLDTNERGRRPIGAIVNYLPVTIREIAITVTGFVNLDSTIEANLLTAFTTAINNVRPYVAGADILEDKNDIIDTNKLIGVIISTKPGAAFTSVSFTVDSVPTSSITLTDGDIPYLNPTITFN